MAEKHRKLAEAAAALNAAHPLGGDRGGVLPPLFFLTDEVRTPDPVAALPGLPDRCGVIFRHYGAKDRMALAREMGKACAMQARLLLLGGVTSIPHGVGAGGIHLPAHMLRTLTELPSARLVTAAVHNEEELRHAEAMGVDAVFVSPIFPTESHPGAPALGVARFTEMVAATAVPVFALGGVTCENAEQLLGTGAYGIAAIGALV